MRVEIPSYTDRWMIGDRYGEVVKMIKKRTNFPVNCRWVSADDRGTYITAYRVRLDKSGKTVCVVADECREV